MFTTSKRVVGNVVILECNGRMAGGFPRKNLMDEINTLVDEGKRQVILKLEGVEFMDSYGLDAMVYSCSRLRDKKGDLKLLSPTPKILDLFQMTKLLTVVDVFEDEASACMSFQKFNLPFL